MKYPKYPDFQKLIQEFVYYSKHKKEYNAKDVDESIQALYKEMSKHLEDLKNLKTEENLNEPSDLKTIKKLRPEGPRRIWSKLEPNYEKQLEGALIARIAGCILGAPVEFHSITDMENWAKYNDEAFPPVDYWKRIKSPYELRYGKSDFIEYTRDGMTKVPVDDDIVYTILNLLIIEEYGTSFTTEDVAESWKKYLPYACTAEEIALENIKKNIEASEVAEINNPYMEWIGADIRSDVFGYIAPGYPEKAAEMAYYDAYLSHRRNGIYGEMFFAAAISAAFTVNDPIEAIKIGLTEIPKDCQLANDINWALSILDQVKDYTDARRFVEERFKGMEHAHTNNNACLTVFGLHIGKNDVTKVIGETVAMGMDNDCTAATGGSIVGAIVTIDNITSNWYNKFNNTIDTYLIGVDEVQIDDVLARLKRLAESIF